MSAGETLDAVAGFSAWLEVVKTYARCQQLLARDLERLGLSVGQYELLLAVGRDEGQPQRRLAARRMVAKSNVTALLDRMEASGWVRRAPSPDDARRRLVFLTPAGRRQLRSAERKHAVIVERMTGEMSADDLARVERAMRGARGALEAALEGQE